MPPKLTNMEPLPHDRAATEEPREGAGRWLDMLAEAATDARYYHEKCDNIDKLYSGLEYLTRAGGETEFQMLWANLEVLKPSIYSRPPVPVVSSRFRDRKQLPRRAADILERALISDFEADALHDTLLLARDDLAIAARGVVWVVMVDRDGIDVPSAIHVDRKDFRHGAARKWAEVPWVARRSWLTKKEFRKRFPDAPLPNFSKRDLGAHANSGDKKAAVWEIWHRADDKVVWVAEDNTRVAGEDYKGNEPAVLDEKEPWLALTGFFPCPRPAYGTMQRGTLTPVPDVAYYQDQLDEINAITRRMSALTDALRLRGFYSSGASEVGEAIETALKSLNDNATLVPISGYAALGGAALKDSIVWLPVREVAEVIAQLREMRAQLMRDTYEVTGISDIMRGDTDANETLGAQQLKSQYGSVRIRERQAEMTRLARDITRMKAEIMSEDMDIATLMDMAQVDDLPSEADLAQQAAPIRQQLQQIVQGVQQQFAQLQASGDPEADQKAQAIQQQAEEDAGPLRQQLEEMAQQVTQEAVQKLLRDQKIRPFVLDIETDSTIMPDENAEKERRVEFMAALGPLLQQGVQAMQLAPQLGAFVAESLKFVASGFRAGRQMEDAIDELAEGFANYQPPQPQGEDPAAAQAAAQAEQGKAQAAQQMAAAKAQEAQAKAQATQQTAQIEAQRAQVEIGTMQQAAAIEGEKAQGQMAVISAQIEKLQAEIARIGAQTQAAKARPDGGRDAR